MSFCTCQRTAFDSWVPIHHSREVIIEWSPMRILFRERKAVGTTNDGRKCIGSIEARCQIEVSFVVDTERFSSLSCSIKRGTIAIHIVNILMPKELCILWCDRCKLCCAIAWYVEIARTDHLTSFRCGFEECTCRLEIIDCLLCSLFRRLLSYINSFTL